MIELDLVGLSIEPPSTTPILLLQERLGDQRVLPIFIGAPEAAAIAFALEGAEAPRPLTHDLFAEVLKTVSVSLSRVVLTELVAGTYFAELELQSPAGEYVVSCRPSDGVALAIRLNAPIVATEQLLDDAGQHAVLDEAFESVDTEEVIEEFRDFIDHVDPDDFG